MKPWTLQNNGQTRKEVGKNLKTLRFNKVMLVLQALDQVHVMWRMYDINLSLAKVLKPLPMAVHNRRKIHVFLKLDSIDLIAHLCYAIGDGQWFRHTNAYDTLGRALEGLHRLVQGRVLEGDVVNEEEPIPGNQLAVDLGNAARYQGSYYYHSLVGVHWILQASRGQVENYNILTARLLISFYCAFFF
jgi:hypothetical protein